MAILRLSLDNIEQEILDATGYTASTKAPWATAANLYRKINLTGQKVVQKAADVLREQGKLSMHGTPHFDMWKTRASSTISTGVTNFVVTAGSTAVLLPNNYDQWISFYDTAHKQFIYPIKQSHAERYRRLLERAPSPIEAIEIQGTNSAGAQRDARWLPDVEAGVTPAVDMEYFRIPATMPGSSPSAEFPDADYKFHYLWILEPLLLVMASDDPAYENYLGQEKELIGQLASSAEAN